MKPILETCAISKLYRLGEREPDSIRETFERWTQKSGKIERAHLWALKDVSFQVQAGSALGVIGRNGSGKSTLLKILSRITEPTSGRAVMRGRVASLLEVGTGFHPDLTGRENVYLNGAILGMRKAEIRRKFEAIVAFAEMEQFIDTPVKHYSSGMAVRLAFAVAAHLEAEILLIDEVLAVGDMKFQERCIGKMNEVAASGRTLLFVSHNMAAVQKLCGSALVLEKGRLFAEGDPVLMTQKYMMLMSEKPPIVAVTDLNIETRMLDRDQNPTPVWKFGQPLIVEVTVFSKKALLRPSVDITFYTTGRICLFSLKSDRLESAPESFSGIRKYLFRIENPGITAPEMLVDVGLREGAGFYRKLVQNAALLSADQASVPSDHHTGLIRAEASLETEQSR